MSSKGTLKKLEDQVVVITGATSGIGMETAQIAAGRGARVILNGRDKSALQEITARIRTNGGEAEYFMADVSDFAAMRRMADFAVERFGRFDT